MSHGKNEAFSAIGVVLCVAYWQALGARIVGFLPEGYVDTRNAHKRPIKKTVPSTEDMDIVQSLVQQGVVVLTPSQDYDDSYAIEYAWRHKGVIVTNDKYRDHDLSSSYRTFVQSHSIRFSFTDTEFRPTATIHSRNTAVM